MILKEFTRRLLGTWSKVFPCVLFEIRTGVLSYVGPDHSVVAIDFLKICRTTPRPNQAEGWSMALDSHVVCGVRLCRVPPDQVPAIRTRPDLTEMFRNGPKSSEIVRNRPKWSKTVQHGPKLSTIVKKNPKPSIFFYKIV